MDSSIFRSFFIGGFESSMHRLRDHRRLDLISGTQHDRFVMQDYARLREVDIHCARDAIRWHLIENSPGRYDWSSVLPMVRAARETKTQILWDLLHFGWPDAVDVFRPEFVERFAGLAANFAALLKEETDEVPFFAPVNEISFLAWAGGDEGFFNPFARRRGDELKAQFVRATIAACEAIWSVLPQARIIHVDPIIGIIADPTRPQDRRAAEGHRQSQFSAWDMIAGRAHPELGGQAKYLDIMGVNYYIQNQWIHNGAVLVPSHPQHLLLRYMLREVYERYERPLFIAETGIENDVRPNWLRYIGREVRGAIRLGIPVQGICLYPILNHPGWNDDRHCLNGLWDYADDEGGRDIFAPLAKELERQQRMFAEMADQDEEREEEAFNELEYKLLDTSAIKIQEATERARRGSV
jgi:beta-glucosidase/6-phospho-beta-glucosidase/beta-galactosidase